MTESIDSCPINEQFCPYLVVPNIIIEMKETLKQYNKINVPTKNEA